MPDPIQPHAKPIVQTGTPEWAPSAEDDNEAALKPRRPQDVHAIFFGRDGLRAGWALLLFAALNALFSVLISKAMHALHGGHITRTPPKFIPVGSVLRTDFSGFAVFALAALLVSLVEKRRFGRYGIDALSPRRMQQFLLGSALGLGLLALLAFVLKTAGLLAFDGVLLHGAAIWKYGALWLLAYLGVGLFEEFVTRGFVQFTLTRGIAGLARTAGLHERTAVILGFWLVALFFSVIFGLGHKSNPGESPIGLVSAGLIGFVFAFSLWRTGSLWWAIGFHAAWDWAESFLFGTANSGLLVENHLLGSHPLGQPLLSGGGTGPEGSVYVVGAILIAVATIAFALPTEPGSYADPNWTPNDPETPRY